MPSPKLQHLFDCTTPYPFLPNARHNAAHFTATAISSGRIDVLIVQMEQGRPRETKKLLQDSASGEWQIDLELSQPVV